MQAIVQRIGTLSKFNFPAWNSSESVKSGEEAHPMPFEFNPETEEWEIQYDQKKKGKTAKQHMDLTTLLNKVRDASHRWDAERMVKASLITP